MNAGTMAFSQVMARVPHWEFRRLARAHDQADGRRQFSSWDHFLALAFAQMTFRESLRNIEACLGTQGLAYHLGFRTRVIATFGDAYLPFILTLSQVLLKYHS